MEEDKSFEVDEIVRYSLYFTYNDQNYCTCIYGNYAGTLTKDTVKSFSFKTIRTVLETKKIALSGCAMDLTMIDEISHDIIWQAKELDISLSLAEIMER